jgi:crotonobetainyl-CoA:carnitine CoA-transferase CaiB-like acyl-CoA transferase
VRGAGPLDGVRVLDFSVWRPGPYATQLLADLGADVLKVEPPGGDPMRAAYPGLFADVNVSKRSIVLDLKRDDDRRRALDLAAGADVVIEGFRPGVAARLGVGPDDVRAVNPAAVYCSLSGFGQDGPLRDTPGHDLNYQAWAGALAPDGGEPRVAAVPVADLAGGMAAALAICAALVGRSNGDGDGDGEYLDVAMADVVATWTGAVTPAATAAAAGQRGVPGYGTFATADGHVTLGVLTEDHFWRALCDALDLGDCRDLGFAARLAERDSLQARITATIATHRRDALVAALLAADVPVAPVLNRDEMTRTAHFVERGAIAAAPWADAVTGPPVRFTRRPLAPRRPPPGLDEHAGAGWLDRAGDD